MPDPVKLTQKIAKLRPVVDVIMRARESFAKVLLEVHQNGGLKLDPYVRYLSMHYHLTSEMQQHFLIVAAHGSLARRNRLRNFLQERAVAKESHFARAKNDLRYLAAAPLEISIDAELWRAYFTPVAAARPFVCLGAATVLENLSFKGCSSEFDLIQRATFLDRRNTSFIEEFFLRGSAVQRTNVKGIALGAVAKIRNRRTLPGVDRPGHLAVSAGLNEKRYFSNSAHFLFANRPNPNDKPSPAKTGTAGESPQLTDQRLVRTAYPYANKSFQTLQSRTRSRH